MCVLGPFAIYLESVVFGRVDGPVGVSLSVCTPPRPGHVRRRTRSPAERPVRPRRTAANTHVQNVTGGGVDRVCANPEGIPETLLPPPRPTPTFALGKTKRETWPTFRPSGPRRRAQPQGGQVSGPRSPIRDRDSYCTVGACAQPCTRDAMQREMSSCRQKTLDTRTRPQEDLLEKIRSKSREPRPAT